MPRSDHDWVHRNYVCLRVRSIELFCSTTYTAAFLISLQIFTNVIETTDRLYKNRKYKDYVYRKMLVQEYLKK